MNTCGAGDQTCFALEINTTARNECVENTSSNFSRTHTQLQPVATSNFQTDLKSRSLLLTGNHLQKQVVSHPRTHLRVYATQIAFAAGLNGLQVEQVDRETTNKLKLTSVARLYMCMCHAHTITVKEAKEVSKQNVLLLWIQFRGLISISRVIAWYA